MPVQYDLDNSFTSSEQEMIDAINAAGQRNGPSLTTIAMGIGAALLLYRKFMGRRMQEELSRAMTYPTTADAVAELATRVLGAYMPKWIPVLAINLAMGYNMGLKEVGASNPEWSMAAATKYAESLGEGINEVSVQAMSEGIRAQLNRGVPMRLAVDRTIEAFGVTPKTMKALVTMWTRTPQKAFTSTQRVNPVSDAIDTRIAKAIAERARVIGDTEARLSMNAAKAMYWAYQAENGDIPGAAEKEWITARDERTCVVCAPLHKVRVLVTEKFPSSIGPIMAPGVHPNCRCELRFHMNLNLSDLVDERELVGKSAWGVVHKALGTDDYDRDASGKFASSEQRGAKGAKKTPQRFKVYGENKLSQSAPEAPFKPAFQADGFKPAFDQSSFKPAFKPIEKPQESFKASEFATKAGFTAKERFQRMEAFKESQFQRNVEIAEQVKEAVAQDTDSAEARAYIVNMGGVLGEYAIEGDKAQTEEALRQIGYDIEDIFSDASTEFIETFEGSYSDTSSDVYNSMVHEPQMSINVGDGTVAHINRDHIMEMLINLHRGTDDTIKVEVSPSGSKHVYGGKSSTEVYSTSELLDAMGANAQNLVSLAIENVSTHAVAPSMDIDDVIPAEERTPLEQAIAEHHNAMMERPFDQELRNTVIWLDKNSLEG